MSFSQEILEGTSQKKPMHTHIDATRIIFDNNNILEQLYHTTIKHADYKNLVGQGGEPLIPTQKDIQVLTDIINYEDAHPFGIYRRYDSFIKNSIPFDDEQLKKGLRNVSKEHYNLYLKDIDLKLDEEIRVNEAKSIIERE